MDARFQEFTDQDARLAETALFSDELLPSLKGSAGARLSEHAWDLENFEYMGELSWSPFSFFSLALRLGQALQLPTTVSETDCVAVAGLSASPFSFLKLFGKFGWYERYVQLTNVLIIPTPFRGDENDYDFVAEIGGTSRLSESLSLTLKLSTFEEIEVYNLNNPFIEARLDYERGPGLGTWFLFGRYQALLGFGRLDQLVVGAGWILDLNSRSDASHS